MTTSAPVHGTKHCPLCDETKSVLAFASHRTNSDGLRGWCRDCQRKKSRQRYIRDHRPHDYRGPERA